VDELYINFVKVGIRQVHKERCSAYFAAYNSVTNSVNKGSEHRFDLIPIEYQSEQTEYQSETD